MSKDYRGNDGWYEEPDGEIASGNNQNQAYFPPLKERDLEIPHDMYTGVGPSDDINIFSDNIDEAPGLDESDEDENDKVIGINDVQGTSAVRKAAKPRHPSMGAGRPARSIQESIHGDSERDTGNPHYHQPPAEPLSPEQVAINKRRLPEARKAITAGPDPDDKAMQPAKTGQVLTPEEIKAGRAAIKDIRTNVLPLNRQNKP